MATHSNILAWEIPSTEEPGGLQSMVSQSRTQLRNSHFRFQRDPLGSRQHFRPIRRGRQRMRWLDGITDSMDMSEQASGDGDGQGSLACCSPQGHKKSDMTEQMNWTELLGGKTWWWWQGHKTRSNSEYVVFRLDPIGCHDKLAVMWQKDICLHDHYVFDLSN